MALTFVSIAFIICLVSAHNGTQPFDPNNPGNSSFPNPNNSSLNPNDTDPNAKPILVAENNSTNSSLPSNSTLPAGNANRTAPVGYSIVNKNDFIEAGKNATTVEEPSLDSCAKRCNETALCQSLMYNVTTKSCVLYPLRRCMTSMIHSPGTTVNLTGELYEKDADVNVGEDDTSVILFQESCANYIGSQINSTSFSTKAPTVTSDDIANFTNICGANCLVAKKQLQCRSWFVTIAQEAFMGANQTVHMRCRHFSNSIFTSPKGYYNVGNTAFCGTNQTSIYGLAGKATSKKNCGMPHLPSPNL